MSCPVLPQTMMGFVLRCSGRHQIALALLAAGVFGLSTVPLELQRRIVNDAIKSGATETIFWLAVAYAGVALLESLPFPTVAVVEGWAVGGGLAIATACDFRIATPGTRFGVPIARTLGNCLSMANIARLVAAFGRPRAERLLLLAEMVSVEEALACGYVLKVATPETITDEAQQLCERLAALAPVTQRVSKEAMNRLLRHGLPDVEDLIRAAYGSEDFHEGVQAFVAKRPPAWKGQ